MAKTKSKKTAGPLDRSPGHLLHRALQRALDLYAAAAPEGAVTQRQYAVLAAVAAHEGSAQSELVALTGIDRSTLAELVSRMIGKDLLARERSTQDARANAVRLTEAGRAALDLAEPQAMLADTQLLALLPRGKRDSFVNLLRVLTSDAEPKPDKPPKEPKPDKPKKDKAEKAARKAAKAEKKKKKALKAVRDQPD